MTDITHEAAKQFATLRDLIADTAADLSNSKPYWTAGCLADALIRTGQLILAQPSGDEVEAACRAWRIADGMNPDCLYEHHEWDEYPEDAREEYNDPFTGQKRVRLMHKSWRNLAKRMAAAIKALDAHRGKQ